MNDFDSDLSAGLGALLDPPAPPSAMSVDRAIRAGSAVRRKRRRAAAGSAVALLGAAALVIAVLLPGSEPGTTPPPAGNPTGPPTATAAPKPALTGTDPVVQTLAFGWLPSGVTTSGFQDQGYSVGTVPAPSRALAASGGGTLLNLTVLTAGHTFPAVHFKGAVIAPHTTAPDVNGRSAYWTFVPGSSEAADDGEVELRWQYAPSSWAQLDAEFGSDTSADVTSTIYRIAQNVQYAGTDQIAVPFHVSQVPAGLTLVGDGWIKGAGGQADIADPLHPTSPWGAGLDFGAAGGSTGAGLRIMVQVANGQTPAGPVPVTALDGHPAQISVGTTSCTLSVYDVDGLNVFIIADSAQAITDVNAVGGLAAYFHTLTLLGPDTSNWTTAVLG